MKTETKENPKPQVKGDRKIDELFFESAPIFYQDLKNWKEELNRIVESKSK
jgi:hypothetical protein